MKNFRINNKDWKNWKEAKLKNAVDVVHYIEQNNLTTYEIEWETPVTGEYAKLIEVQNGQRVFTSNNFILPGAFKNL